MPSFRVGLLASAVAMGAATAQAPSGYHVGAYVAVPDSLVEVFADGRFRATVLRKARTAEERRLLDAAERLYPDADKIIGVARDSGGRAKLVALAAGTSADPYKIGQRSAGSPADRWWLDEFDATWIPFAITSGAVDYYLGRLRDIAAGRGPFKYGPTDGGDRGSFEYRASFHPGTSPGVAHIVELRVSWDYWCGPMCAMSFTHTRTVWFDAKGSVVRVIGDGRPLVIVS